MSGTVKTYHLATFGGLKGNLDAINRPATQAIEKNLQKFVETESVRDIVRPLLCSFARST